MKDEKEPLEQKQNSEEEEYSFLQEIIKDEAGDQAKWKHDVLRRIQLGLIFGLVACFTFFACKPWVEKRFEENPTEVTIPQDEQQEEEQTQQEEEQVQEQKTVLTTETYQEMLNNRELQRRARSQADAFGAARRTAEAQMKTLQAQQETALLRRGAQ